MNAPQVHPGIPHPTIHPLLVSGWIGWMLGAILPEGSAEASGWIGMDARWSSNPQFRNSNEIKGETDATRR